MKNFSIKVPQSTEQTRNQIKSGKNYFIYKEHENYITIGKPIWYKNDFAPLLHLQIHGSESETIIDCQLKMKSWVRVFMFFWLAFVSLATVITFFSIISEINSQTKSFVDLKVVLIPVGMFFFGIALIKFGEIIARKNTGEMVDWIIKLFPNGVVCKNERN